MASPMFSVIVPAHNAEAFLDKCLHSIRYQKTGNKPFTDYELIVVCDNCTDDTAEIATGYADKVITTQYGLDGLARNAGIDAAEGEWILFLDHDDWWLHEYVLDMLKNAIECRANQRTDMIFFDFIWKGVGYIPQHTPGSVAVWNKCWRREFIGETRFSDLPHWSDVGFHRAMMEKCPVYATFGYPMYYYNYLKPGSISWQAEQGMIERYKEVQNDDG